ncbi:hypothetical protein EI94DRAFT_528330 [Lactarius quietus]|nr:hypothetical protein EI94DRAFT_528330 [Lactarius quietus]
MIIFPSPPLVICLLGHPALFTTKGGAHARYVRSIPSLPHSHLAFVSLYSHATNDCRVEVSRPGAGSVTGSQLSKRRKLLPVPRVPRVNSRVNMSFFLFHFHATRVLYSQLLALGPW